MCGCRRCDLARRAGDDTRRFRCRVEGCRGSCLSKAEVDELMPCDVCGVLPDSATAAEAFREEAAALALLLRVEALSADEGNAPLILGEVAVVDLHPHHYLAARFANVRMGVYDDMGRYGDAALAMASRLACRRSILSPPPREPLQGYEEGAAYDPFCYIHGCSISRSRLLLDGSRGPREYPCAADAYLSQSLARMLQREAQGARTSADALPLLLQAQVREGRHVK